MNAQAIQDESRAKAQAKADLWNERYPKPVVDGKQLRWTVVRNARNHLAFSVKLRQHKVEG